MIVSRVLSRADQSVTSQCQYCGMDVQDQTLLCANCGEANPVFAVQPSHDGTEQAEARFAAMFRSVRSIRNNEDV
jgi:primosomal protein N'